MYRVDHLLFDRLEPGLTLRQRCAVSHVSGRFNSRRRELDRRSQRC